MSPITFCISTYNNLPYLKLAIESVRKNSFYKNAPFIVYAENCNDGTDEWLSDAKDQYNLEYYIEKNNVPKGIGGGMNFCADKVKTKYIMFLHSDFSVTENGKYKYKNIIVDDFGNLISSQTDKNKQKLLIAASMRYKYMNIGTHGLALDYASIGFKPTDAVTEGFGGVFNHYFDNFCSAFPDLEAPFGSIGNFFSVEQFPTKVVHVNPPYDETVMTQVVKRVRYMLDKDPSYTFVLTFPDWPNFKAKDDISKDSRTYKVKRFEKGNLIFIDYFEGKRIAPVKIIMIYIGNDKHFIPEF